MHTSQSIHAGIPFTFVVFRGMLAAASLVSASTLTWIVSKTQPDMSIRVTIQMVAGLLALLLAGLAASIVKRRGGPTLVAILVAAAIPLPWFMSWLVTHPQISAYALLGYGLAVALIDAFAVPAQEALQNHLFSRASHARATKTTGVQVRSGTQFVARILLWASLATGAIGINGVGAARATFLTEMSLLCSFLVVTLLLRRIKQIDTTQSAINTATSEKRSLAPIFWLEFCLNGFFLGALMLPKTLPTSDLSTMNWVLALGGLGSLLGTISARVSPTFLWMIIVADLVTASVTFSQTSTAAIAVGWFFMSFCYGAFDTVFARAVQAGHYQQTAEQASFRRLLMNGLRPFTMFLIIKAQALLGIGDREIVFWSLGLTVAILIPFAVIQWNRINETIADARG